MGRTLGFPTRVTYGIALFPKNSPSHCKLEALLPPRFLEQVPFARLIHFPRYLKAMLIRAERAVVNPSKDLDKARQVAPIVEQWRELTALPDLSRTTQCAVDELRWLLEEFKVSVFAQELGNQILRFTTPD
jgi:ATP-dependent helicase HrpA